jgi:DNA-binding response OmpR family regulator
MAVRVLLIDDDAKLRDLVSSYLRDNGVDVTACADGTRGLDALDASPFDAVLLDIMMPGIDGLEVLRRIRKKNHVPVLMLTAKGDEMDRVVGLEIGADDYLAKPFGPRELLARLRAVLRRASPDLLGDLLRAGTLEIDVGARLAVDAGKSLELTGIEFDLLVALVRRAGRVVTREALLAEAGRNDVAVSDRTVDVHVSHLRQKLGDDPRAPARLKTVRGVGYVFSKDPA